MFFDPGGDGWDIEDVAKLLGVIALIGGFLAALIRYWTRKFASAVEGIVVKHTAPIQPNANGGKSLPDVAAKVDLVLARQSDIAADVTELKVEQAAIASEFRGDLRTLGARLNQHATDRTIHTKG